MVEQEKISLIVADCLNRNGIFFRFAMAEALTKVLMQKKLNEPWQECDDPKNVPQHLNWVLAKYTCDEQTVLAQAQRMNESLRCFERDLPIPVGRIITNTYKELSLEDDVLDSLTKVYCEIVLFLKNNESDNLAKMLSNNLINRIYNDLIYDLKKGSSNFVTNQPNLN